jgi:hypothetical protein
MILVEVPPGLPIPIGSNFIYLPSFHPSRIQKVRCLIYSSFHNPAFFQTASILTGVFSAEDSRSTFTPFLSTEVLGKWMLMAIAELNISTNGVYRRLTMELN